MKVRKEEIGRHRRSEQPPKRRKWFWWLFLPLMLIFFYLAYAERSLLETYAKRLEAEFADVAGVLGLPSDFLLGDSVQTIKENPEPQPPAEPLVVQPPIPDLWTLEQGQAQENKITKQQEKINLLTKEVRYVGAVMRRLSASAETLQSGVSAEKARLRGIGQRLETLDTNMQAFGEKSLNDRTELNRVMAELQKGLATLLSDNDANKKRLDQIEASISNLNSRLIELEK